MQLHSVQGIFRLKQEYTVLYVVHYFVLCLNNEEQIHILHTHIFAQLSFVRAEQQEYTVFNL
jgi:hypothetical protein